MIDYFLEWAVVFLPLVYGFTVELVSKRVKDKRYWRSGVIAFAASISVLIWLQQLRAHSVADSEKRHSEEEILDLKTRMEMSTELVGRVLSSSAAQQTFLASLAKDLKLKKPPAAPLAPTSVTVTVVDGPPLYSMATAEFKELVKQGITQMRDVDYRNRQDEERILTEDQMAVQTLSNQQVRANLLRAQSAAAVARQVTFQKNFRSTFGPTADIYKKELLRRLGKPLETDNPEQSPSEIESELEYLASQLH